MLSVRHQVSLLVAIALSVTAGCGVAANAKIAAEGKKFVADSEPPDAKSIAAAKAGLDSQSDVVVVGQILANQLEPFDKDKATFVLTELPEDGHAGGKGHDASSCPFCKRRAAKAPKAIVQFVDEQGELLPIAAPRLVGLEKDQVVVVQGRGKLDAELDIFFIVADRIHIRR